MEYLQRYSFHNVAATLGAGLYTGVVAVTINTSLFPILINEFNVSAQAIDTVTDQSIDGSFEYNLGIAANSDNPGITGSNLLTRIVSNFAGNVVQNTYFIIPPSTTISGSVQLMLETVTANDITARFSVRVGYLCPKDFLSTEGLTAGFPG